MVESIISPWQERAEFYENALVEVASPTFWLDLCRYPQKEYFEWRVVRVGEAPEMIDIVGIGTDHILAMNGMDEAHQRAYLRDTFKPYFDLLRRNMGLG